MARMVMSVLCVIMTCLVLTAHYTEAITCADVDTQLEQCRDYIRNGGDVPLRCCVGVRALNLAAKVTLDRQVVCDCIKSAFTSDSQINVNIAASLPEKCGINLSFNISPDTDCSRVV